MICTEPIAILLATYNGETFIREQLNSLINQTYQQWALYIHDDGSSDNTPSIILEYAQKYPEKIHILNGPATGSAKNNFLYMMQNVTAPYIMFCDQDDVWFENKIELTFRKMLDTEQTTGKTKPVLVFSDLTVVDQDLNIIAERLSEYQQLNPANILVHNLIIQNVVTGCTVMINKCLNELAIRFSCSENIIMHDWWCALIAAYYGTITFIDVPLIFYRQHKDNSIGAKRITDLKYIKEKLKTQNEIKRSLVDTQKQICTFTDSFALNDQLLLNYAHLSHRRKIERILFYIKHHVKKSSCLRNIGLLIWG